MGLEILTERQRQILNLSAKGLQAPDVASELGCSPKTVRNQLSNIYQKLGVNNKVQAVAYLLTGGRRDN
ncbi:response regulator transcription factor [Parachitinimonas caeni]|uniref:Helix-turn-helix transcriptional regulator n=1 Tax=Parachitinimonas caeni TaxID=3031301 RepID=A0ABT7E3C1_9NEIS|nr:helix-turn-helix transcriptional regulator [Parachitinimonas caeni]MDK2126800.1 helix-turn-helix transcriptional regulator [Parachitinimonas caeni]